MAVMQHGWDVPVSHQDVAKRPVAKFKNLRRVLKNYSQLSNLAVMITNNKLVLQFMDSLEESHDLSLEEWNFRQMVQGNLEMLLEQQRVYWKQRGSIKWAKLGDKNTRIFHANATVRHNRNSIRALKDSNDLDQYNHEGNASIIWEYFKDRLGRSEYSHMYFDLDDILHSVDGLETLVTPFSKEEIDAIVNDLPSGKSPGPDGFNTDFLKKCWSNIANDFYEMCFGFYEYQWVLYNPDPKN
jgi:hypothetical protein